MADFGELYENRVLKFFLGKLHVMGPNFEI